MAKIHWIPIISWYLNRIYKKNNEFLTLLNNTLEILILFYIMRPPHKLINAENIRFNFELLIFCSNQSRWWQFCEPSHKQTNKGILRFDNINSNSHISSNNNNISRSKLNGSFNFKKKNQNVNKNLAAFVVNCLHILRLTAINVDK